LKDHKEKKEPLEHIAEAPVPVPQTPDVAAPAKDPAVEAAMKAALEEAVRVLHDGCHSHLFMLTMNIFVVQKRVRLRDNFAKEIYSTEVTYVSSLQVAVTVRILIRVLS